MKDMWMTGTEKNLAMHKSCISFLEREVKDPNIREKLRPTSAFGCKRVLFLDDWYSLFNERNVELVTEKPIRITRGAIVSKPPHALSAIERAQEPVGSYLENEDEIQGHEIHREIDVLIWGTGFDMNDSGGHFKIYGENGVLLSNEWKDNPETYWSKWTFLALSISVLTISGVAITGFPNLFLTCGPNSTNYWSNITTVVEIQINWHCKMIKLIKSMTKQGTYVVYPRKDVQKALNDWLRENRGTPSFLEPECATYHKVRLQRGPEHDDYTH